MLKEKCPLVLVVRETPLHKGHLELMSRAADYGATILPPVPAFYHDPESIDDIVNHTVGRVFDQFDLEHQLYHKTRSLRLLPNAVCLIQRQLASQMR